MDFLATQIVDGCAQLSDEYITIMHRLNNIVFRSRTYKFKQRLVSNKKLFISIVKIKELDYKWEKTYQNKSILSFHFRIKLS